jgi:cobalt/nickel transport system permease protein
MHLASEAVTLECAALGFAAAASGVGYSLWHLPPASGERTESVAQRAAKAAALGSLVFAAQLLNFPVLASSSVHFIGGVLLAELLGPALGVLTMAAVLLLQAAILGDGGVVALGVNITNMALLPAACLMLARRAIASRHVALATAGAASVALAVLLIGGEVALGRAGAELSHWSSFVSAMLTNHLPLLPLEGALTVAFAALWKNEKSSQRSVWRVPAMAAATAVVLALFAAVASSSLPDGYEAAAVVAQMEGLLKPQ